MKVRWTTGSVRFRITPGELAALQRGEAVTIALPLGGGASGWRATLLPEAGGDGAVSRLCGEGDGALVMRLAAADVARLAEPSAEGIYFRAPLGEDSEGLRFFVEKDFPCVHPRPPETQEADAETFTPPPGFARRHGGGTGGA
jgi:hypothetical protein